MLVVETESGTTYHINEEESLIRRVPEAKKKQFSDDGEWQWFRSVTLIKKGRPMIIVLKPANGETKFRERRTTKITNITKVAGVS